MSIIPFGKKESRAVNNPFQRLRQEIDALFNAPWEDFHSLSSMRNINIDFYDNDKEIIIKADTPGFSENDLDISLNNQILNIKGKKDLEQKEEKDNYYMLERSHGSFSRSIQLPFQPQHEEIKAKLDKGILTITIKKSQEEGEQSKKIKIES